MKLHRWITTAALVLLTACEGPAGPEGRTGAPGTAGTAAPGEQGPPGEDGDPGNDGNDGYSAYLTGPGLNLEVLDIALASSKATITFRLTDGTGIPLDREGLYTEGPVSTSFVLAWLDEGLTEAGETIALQYNAYTTRDQTSPITNVTATQASADQNGTYAAVDVAQGIYTYELGSPVVVADAAKTHTLGAWATRDFDGARYVANVVQNFLPSGGEPTMLREIVETDACNKCHTTLEAHGGARREASLCILCHSPQTADPDTGNTVDMAVMIHKIHRGKDLPSVVAGTPYQIIGFQQGVNDYSTVAYPQELENCKACHTGPLGDNWKNHPTRAGCASCHDDVSFENPPPAGMILHAGGVQADDNKCSVCHPPAGGLEGIETKHLTANLDPLSPKIELAILGVDQTGPGAYPEVVFEAKQDGAPLDVLTTPLTRLTITIAGPTTDYASYWQEIIQGTGAAGGTLTAEGAAGTFRYVMKTVMPVTATGSYAVGLEGYNQASSTAPRYAAMNPIFFVGVTDAVAVPRRDIVDQQGCENCHFKLEGHGGSRRSADYCALCHNPNNLNDERAPHFENASATVPTVDLKMMIHRIHTGEDLSQPYVLGGFPTANSGNPAGTPVDFSEVRYPGDRRACASCHAGSSFTLPLPTNTIPTITSAVYTCTEDPAADANDYCPTANFVLSTQTTLGAAGAACTGCHDAPEVTAHAETMTAASGIEACATCHGPGSEFDVDVVHALDP